MITSPLGLESRLRKAPRNFDAFFYLNLAVIVGMFVLFGSKFVMLPGFNVVMPRFESQNFAEPAAGLRVLVQQNEQIFFEGAFYDREGFREKLRKVVEAQGRVSLILQADRQVPYRAVFDLSVDALDLGASVNWAAENASAVRSEGPAAGAR